MHAFYVHFFSFTILKKDSFFHGFIHVHNTIVHSNYSHPSSPAISLQLVNHSLLLASPSFSSTSFCFALVFNFNPLSVHGCRGLYRIIGLVGSYSTNDNDSCLPKNHHMILAPQKRDSTWYMNHSPLPCPQSHGWMWRFSLMQGLCRKMELLWLCELMSTRVMSCPQDGTTFLPFAHGSL